MTPSRHRYRFLAFAAVFAALAMPSFLNSDAEPAAGFSDYWYQGKAELTSYDLEQVQYGEVHRGQAVTIFVTEDFSRSRQVKLDGPARKDEDGTSVLKLNLTRNFNTGIYSYSMMSSVFSQLSSGEALKATTSVQDWCGHTWSQLNRQDDGFRARLFSYFGSEGDQDVELGPSWVEDGLWTQLRINPDGLPTGELQLLPGLQVQRLRHLPWRAVPARASFSDDPTDPSLRIYHVEYPGLDSSLSIHFQREFPHQIEAWQEEAMVVRGGGAKRLTTRAVRKKRLMLDYWNRNRTIDAPLRQKLGLP